MQLKQSICEMTEHFITIRRRRYGNLRMKLMTKATSFITTAKKNIIFTHQYNESFMLLRMGSHG
ncbi:CLUMA_CG008087, isoform A [Clunio marinus]|uniref:CLUMA_CG008087, isoform A n=1 Tax=Clunio marinus TaxID=568069 RepID=A0A1J1I317_9DIPT|nr:CLUMA_CG008087, isoform A [Clunio marinus]